MSNELEVLEPSIVTGAPDAPAPDLGELQGLLSRAYSIITVTLKHLRQSQNVLQHATVQKLHDTSAKLSEVSSATESAAMDIMSALDRAMALIDQLDEGAPAAEVTGDLRDELFGVMNHLQFQDITTQQLQFAASLLNDMEQQLSEFAQLFDQKSLAGALGEAASDAEGSRTFDPAATIHNAEERQALVDELLTARD